MKSGTAITLELRPSRLLAIALALVAGAAIAALWLSELQQWPWIAAAVTIVVAFALRRTLWRLQRLRWTRATWNAHGEWSLLDATQTITGAHLSGWSALGLLLLLRLRTTAGDAVTLYLLPDNLDRDTRRRLRVRLAQEPADAGGSR